MDTLVSRIEMDCNLKTRCSDAAVSTAELLRLKKRRRTLLGMGNSQPYQQFGRRLKAARVALGWDSAAAFARHLKWSAQTYRQYERGERFPGYSEIRQLAAVGVSVTWIILDMPPATAPVARAGEAETA